jgi:transposase
MMDKRRRDLVQLLQSQEDQIMLAPGLVDLVRDLARDGHGIKAIARRLGIARNTVRRYLAGAAPGHQERPAARRWGPELRTLAVQLYHDLAEGNAVVVQQELAARGWTVPLRSLQALLAPVRREDRARQLATVRFETEPGEQLQIDFGEKVVTIAGRPTCIHLMAVVLGYSRRLYCRPFLAERQDDWTEGIQEALEHFGGMPLSILCDNASPLVLSHDPVTDAVVWHPGFAASCKDRNIKMQACRVRRARTKGKIERVVGYIKHNALAGRSFPSFEALRRHLLRWAVEVADRRIHRTTRERPADRFERAERAALRPLPARTLPVRTRRPDRRVSNDCFVDVDTVRYSVPHRFVREKVQVVVDRQSVEVWHRGVRIAVHPRTEEPHATVRDPAHFAGLYKPARSVPPGVAAPSAGLLGAYAEVVEGRQP